MKPVQVIRAVVGWIAPLVILGAGVAAFAMLGRQPPPERKAGQQRSVPLVRTIEVAPESGGLSIELDGVVVPLREVTLAAEVPGRVRHKAEACRAGRFVTSGTLLFEIDPRDYELDVARLEREHTQARLSIDEVDEELNQNATSIDLAQQQLDLARREVRRLEGLKAGRIVTEAEHDRALREELSATASLSTLQGQARVLRTRRLRVEEGLALAVTLLEKARLDLSRTRVVAPTSGVVVEDHVEQDSFVSKGMALVTIEDTSAAEVRMSLQMDEVARIWRSASGTAAASAPHDLPDAPVTVVYSIGGRTYEWDGTLSRQEGRGLEEKTRTLPCRVRIDDPTKVRALDRYGAALQKLPPGTPRALLRGMFVQVRVHVESSHPLVSIPEEARQPTGEVWLIRDGRLAILQPRPVQVTDGRAVFEVDGSGMQAGDRVVVSQLKHPRDGMEVAEAKAPPAPRAANASLEAGDPS